MKRAGEEVPRHHWDSFHQKSVMQILLNTFVWRLKGLFQLGSGCGRFFYFYYKMLVYRSTFLQVKMCWLKPLSACHWSVHALVVPMTAGRGENTYKASVSIVLGSSQENEARDGRTEVPVEGTDFVQK